MQCAGDIQRELKTRNAELPDERKLEFRIGVNFGDVMVKGENIYGDGVNITAWLEVPVTMCDSPSTPIIAQSLISLPSASEALNRSSFLE